MERQGCHRADALAEETVGVRNRRKVASLEIPQFDGALGRSRGDDAHVRVPDERGERGRSIRTRRLFRHLGGDKRLGRVSQVVKFHVPVGTAGDE